MPLILPLFPHLLCFAQFSFQLFYTVHVHPPPTTAKSCPCVIWRVLNFYFLIMFMLRFLRFTVCTMHIAQFLCQMHSYRIFIENHLMQCGKTLRCSSTDLMSSAQVNKHSLILATFIYNGNIIYGISIVKIRTIVEFDENRCNINQQQQCQHRLAQQNGKMCATIK